MHIKLKSSEIKLEKCYYKSLKRLIKINIKYDDHISEILEKLRAVNLLPLKLRIFYRFCTFIYNLYHNKNNICNIFTKNHINTRRAFALPDYNKNSNFKRYSCEYIAKSILNKFLGMMLESNKSIFKSELLKNILAKYNDYHNDREKYIIS